MTSGPILFNKFVKMFVNLAMYDESEANFGNTLNTFKEIYDATDNLGAKILHIKFVSRYCRFMYEDAYENL